MAKNHYVKERDLYLELCKSNEQKKLTDECITMFGLMADGIQSKFRYDSDDDRQDCRSNAILKCLTKWDKYDIYAGKSAFSYFTQMIKNALYEEWNKLRSKRADFSTSNIFTNEI